ncbi:4-amino-4-deoxychorismate lyase [Paenibacillus sp. HJL G12]|uniref:4-amino-4-deoxychorismate lyase n=1 Tax=Paenibacillus dendrobii TaxID=2691084 RepID=A0A7X3IP51_9BACL|nr:aminotransferase class IV [Paenibacillus dendrobii]MWV47549.1 4-amino-4-deoxychorismate lyase [Paenibacillus dendrobii]
MKWILLNGQCIDAADAVVSVMDHGFLYGMGLFETLRTYRGSPFLLDRHLNRMAAGCRLLGIDTDTLPNQEEMRQLIGDLMKANGLVDAYIRFTVSAGEDVLGLPAGAYSRPNQVLMAKPLPESPGQLYSHGKALQLLSTRRNSPEGPVRLKSLHYMNNILAKRELSSYAEAVRLHAEGMMLNSDGYLSEGIVSNLFFVKNNQLYTPDMACGLLPGITRGLVMELASAEGIVCTEGFYTWEDLKQADEIWLTTSIQELVPVTTLIDGSGDITVISGGRIGPVTDKLLRLYRQQTGGYDENNNL